MSETGIKLQRRCLMIYKLSQNLSSFEASKYTRGNENDSRHYLIPVTYVQLFKLYKIVLYTSQDKANGSRCKQI